MPPYNEKKEEMCDGCPLCCPEDYTVEVDLSLLKTAKKMYETLHEINPDLVAVGWIQEIEEKIKESIKSYI